MPTSSPQDDALVNSFFSRQNDMAMANVEVCKSAMNMLERENIANRAFMTHQTELWRQQTANFQNSVTSFFSMIMDKMSSQSFAPAPLPLESPSSMKLISAAPLATSIASSQSMDESIDDEPPKSNAADDFVGRHRSVSDTTSLKRSGGDDSDMACSTPQKARRRLTTSVVTKPRDTEETFPIRVRSAFADVPPVKQYAQMSVQERQRVICEELKLLSEPQREVLYYIVERALDTTNGAVFGWPVMTKEHKLESGKLKTNTFMVVDLLTAAVVSQVIGLNVTAFYEASCKVAKDDMGLYVKENFLSGLFPSCTTLFNECHSFLSRETLVPRHEFPFCRSVLTRDGKMKSDAWVIPLELFHLLAVALDVQPLPRDHDLDVWYNKLYSNKVYKPLFDLVEDPILFIEWSEPKTPYIEQCRNIFKGLLLLKDRRTIKSHYKEMKTILGNDVFSRWAWRQWTRNVKDTTHLCLDFVEESEGISNSEMSRSSSSSEC